MLTVRHHKSAIICSPAPADADMTQRLLGITVQRCVVCFDVAVHAAAGHLPTLLPPCLLTLPQCSPAL